MRPVPPLLLALVSISCRSSPTPKQVEPAPAPPSVDEAALDPSVDPCDDFYAYACGNWLKTTPIPPDKPLWGRSFSTISDRNEQILRAVMEADAAGKPDPADPFAQTVGDFYATCMDEEKAETASLRSLRELFARIDAVKDSEAVARIVARMHQTGATPFFRFRSAQDAKDATQVIGLADQGGVGLPDRDYYLKTDPRMLEIRNFYEGHVARMLALAGAGEAGAKAEAAKILAIETALAEASMDKVDRRDPYKVYHRLEKRGLAEKAPHFSWEIYFKERGHPEVQAINVTVPDFFVGLDALVSRTSSADLHAYLRWRALEASADALGRAFVDEKFRLTRKLTGQAELAPRWKRCVAMTDRALGEAAGRTFVASTIGDEGKRIAKDLIQGIESAFEENLPQVAWMDAQTRGVSLDKLHKVKNKVGYPDKWRDYSKIRIGRTSLLDNLRAAAEFETDRDLDKIGKPVDRNEWGMTPPTVNAYYNASMNEMVFPAGILQPPFFKPEAALAANLGGIGMVMGHELTHGFDDRGRQYDGDGNLREWWTKPVSDAYNERAACVVRQYDEYIAVDDVHLNGKLTLGENIADIGGLKLALHALRARRSARPTASGKFTDEQQLFLGFAQAWCTNRTPEVARLRALIDPHSSPQWRVNGPVSDNPEFAAAFQCRPGARMNPKARCTVW